MYITYFSDNKAHLKSFNFLKNRTCALYSNASNAEVGKVFWKSTAVPYSMLGLKSTAVLVLGTSIKKYHGKM